MLRYQNSVFLLPFSCKHYISTGIDSILSLKFMLFNVQFVLRFTVWRHLFEFIRLHRCWFVRYCYGSSQTFKDSFSLVLSWQVAHTLLFRRLPVSFARVCKRRWLANVSEMPIHPLPEVSGRGTAQYR